MEDLLPYYERELAFMRRYSRDFAERYPKIAGRLLLAGESSEDPHVERLMQAFALMGARISKKLDDDYPEFTQSLLGVLYPHYLRPFPSCSIAHFDMGDGEAQLTEPATIARGTELLSRSVKGVQCRFRTAYDVTLLPLRLTSASFSGTVKAPSSIRLPSHANTQLSLQFTLPGQQQHLAALDVKKVRVFVDGESSLCAVLRDALALNVERAYVETGQNGNWTKLPENPFHPVGMEADEALFDMPAQSHPAYRLLTEFFAFPAKFGFFDIDATQLGNTGKTFTLHLLLKGISTDSVQASQLESISKDNFKLGCTPIVNLFPMRGEPIRVTRTTTNYPVLADARRAWAYEVHSINNVACVRKTEQGENIIEYRPLYSLRHGETPGRNEKYWVANRNEALAERSPGYELELSMVDLDFNPVMPKTDVLSCELNCTNRDLPEKLAYGIPGGDLALEGGSVARAISMLRKPTSSYRFDSGHGAHWRLISHLSLNHISLVEGGAKGLREMLRLYDLPHSLSSASQIDGIVDLQSEAATAWLPGKPFGSLVRGTNIYLTIDESHFVGTGIQAFAQVMDRFFALSVQANSFTRFILLSSQSGEELLRCPARSGESILV